MKVLVTYGSHLGSTAAMAERIGAVIDAAGLEVSVQPAAMADAADGAGSYDAFVIGGGTYGGRWHPDAVAFIRGHAGELVSKPVWLFSSGPLGSTPVSEAKEPSEIAELAPLVRARGHAVFAGSFDRGTVDAGELGRVERFVAKRFIPEGDWRDWPSIEAWARSIAVDLKAAPVVAL